MKVNDLPELDRPRERLFRFGVRALSDRELVAILLSSGKRGQGAIDLAAVLIGNGGRGLAELARADPHALKLIPGIGEAKAARVAAAFELARRAGLPEEIKRISRSADVALAAIPYLRGLPTERVMVIVCDHGGGVIRVAPLSEGGTSQSLIPVTDVLKLVLSVGGARFAVAHNHPSGSLKPSDADIEVTSRLRASAATVGLRFLDHVIVTETEWSRIP
jgi:DNA repair protein RadC